MTGFRAPSTRPELSPRPSRSSTMTRHCTEARLGSPPTRPRTCLSRSSHRGPPAPRDETPGRPTELPSVPLGPRVTPGSPGRGGPTAGTGGCGGPRTPREGCRGVWRPAGLPRAHTLPRQTSPRGTWGPSPSRKASWPGLLTAPGLTASAEPTGDLEQHALPPLEAPLARWLCTFNSGPLEGTSLSASAGNTEARHPTTQQSTEPLQMSKSSGPIRHLRPQGARTLKSKGTWHFQGQKGPEPDTGHWQGEFRQNSYTALSAASTKTPETGQTGGDGGLQCSWPPGTSELLTGGRPGEGPARVPAGAGGRRAQHPGASDTQSSRGGTGNPSAPGKGPT